MRRRGQQEFELNGKQVHQFITFWRGLYQTHTPPKLEKRDYEVKLPSEHQIKNLIKHMPSRKAPGPDWLTAELLKAGNKSAAEMTVKLVQTIWKTAEIPVELSKANIWLIPKGSSNADDPSSYRPITLMNIWAKIVDKLVNRNISRHLEDKQMLSDEQAGFRRGRSCAEQILTLELISQIQSTKGY